MPDVIDDTPQPQTPPQNDGLDEYRNDDGEFDVDKIRKLAEDKKYYRQQISKLKQMPDKMEAYSKDFVLDSKFDNFLQKAENKDKINTIFEKLDKLSMEKGINVERNHDIRRFVLDELVENGAIDLTTDDQRKAEYDKIVAERDSRIKEVLGEMTDMDAWTKNLIDFVEKHCGSDAVFAKEKDLIKTNASWALHINSLLHGSKGLSLPPAISDEHFNEAEWQKAFHKAQLANDYETQDRMLIERAQKIMKAKK